MDLLSIIIVGGTLLAFVLLGVAGWLYQIGREESQEAKVQSRLGFVATEEQEEEALASLIRDEAEDTLREALGDVGDTIRLTLQQAGSELTVSEFLQRCAGLGAIATIITVVYFGPSTFFLGFVVAYVPWALMKSRAASRARDLLDQMPDALELMGRAMQAGTGLSETFALVAKEMPDPVASDFGRVYESVRFGKDWRDAMDDLINANPSIFDLRLFASSLILQREAGGNTIDTVNRIAKLIRQRAVFDAKVKAMSAEARSSGMILAGMPIAVGLLVFAAQPTYLTPMVNTPLGQTVTVACIASYVVGVYTMRTVSRVEG